MKLTVRVEDNGLNFCFIFYFHLFSYLGLRVRVSVTSHVTVTVIWSYNTEKVIEGFKIEMSYSMITTYWSYRKYIDIRIG